jgi:hypothetical protein
VAAIVRGIPYRRLRRIGFVIAQGGLMRRLPLFAALQAVAVTAAAGFGTAQLRTGAQSDATPAPDPGFAGAWRVTFDTPAGPSQSLLTIAPGGTVLFSGRPVSPAAGGNPITFASAGHGAWEQTGPDTAAITWIGLVTDGAGNFLAVVTDSVEATLDPGANAWSGSYSATVADPDGNVLYVGNGTVRAARITVQPLATPST